MKKNFFILLLVLPFLLTACASSGQSETSDGTQCKVMLDKDIMTLTQPALVQEGEVYISSTDIATLPSVSINYTAATGEIVITGKDVTLDLKIGEPLKAGDKNGLKPFLNKGILYLPLVDVAMRLSFGVQIDQAPDGMTVITLIKQWTDAQDQWQLFSEEELKTVDEILAKGITINDPQNDWAPINEGIQPDGRKDNGYPYPISFTDVKRVSFGADEQYLYIKIEMYDILPEKVVSWENTEFNKTDYIFGMGCNLGLSRFFNRNIGKDDQGLMQTGIRWIEGGDRENVTNPKFVSPPTIGTSSFATPTGEKDQYNEDISAMASGEGKVAGGAGKNYFLGAFPLKNFGLQLGDVIEFSISVEVGSQLFHHECIDNILNNNYKQGDTIRYKLGEGKYENLGPDKGLLPLTDTLAG
jgi:hypothetical protein